MWSIMLALLAPSWSGPADVRPARSKSFSFNASIDGNADIIATPKTLIYIAAREVVAVDVVSRSKLWQTKLPPLSPAEQTDFAWPSPLQVAETDGVILLFSTYRTPSGTATMRIIAIRRSSGKVMYSELINSNPKFVAGASAASRLETLRAENNYLVPTQLVPNAKAINGKVLVIPDVEFDPHLFVIDARTGHCEAEANPAGIADPKLVSILPSLATLDISFGAVVLHNGRLISFSRSTYGTPTSVRFVKGSYLAQYHVDSRHTTLSYTGPTGVALLSEETQGSGRFRDLWKGKYMAANEKEAPAGFFGPYLGLSNEGICVFKAVYLKNDPFSVEFLSLTGSVLKEAACPARFVTFIFPDYRGHYLVDGEFSYDEYDLEGNHLLSFSRRSINRAKVLPCGLVYTNSVVKHASPPLLVHFWGAIIPVATNKVQHLDKANTRG